MLIRPASEEDLPRCGSIYADAFSVPPYREIWEPVEAAEMLGELFKKDPISCWCAEEDGIVVGFVFCTTVGRFHAMIQEFAVDPSRQGQGIGTALMQYTLDQYANRGVKSAELVVNRHAAALSLYRKFGFTPPKDYILMVKSLL